MPTETGKKPNAASSAKVQVAQTESPSSYPMDWPRIVKTFLVSRALDDLEENALLPEKKILYQFLGART